MSACKKHKKKNDENCAMNSLLKRRHAIAGTPSPSLLKMVQLKIILTSLWNALLFFLGFLMPHK